MSPESLFKLIMITKKYLLSRHFVQCSTLYSHESTFIFYRPAAAAANGPARRRAGRLGTVLTVGVGRTVGLAKSAGGKTLSGQ